MTPFDPDAPPPTVLTVGPGGVLERPPGMSEEEFAVHKKRTEAIWHYEQTGDRSLMVEAGLFPQEEEGELPE